jgi:hypothetical protein
MINSKMRSYALGLMLVAGLSVSSATAQTGRRQERQIEPQQNVVQIPNQRNMPQRQNEQDRWNDRWDDRSDRLADRLERVRERQELQRIRQLDRQRQLRYQNFRGNRVVGYYDRFGRFHAVGYYDRLGNFWRYR